MNRTNRTSNFITNMKVGLIIQILTPLLAFFSRTVFIIVLGEQYLGINGLFSNILSVLSLADLGVYTAMIFSLYQPIAERRETVIAGILNFYKKVYRVVALLVFGLGLCLVPFLQYIVNGSTIEIWELRVYYVIYLFNTSCSYLLVYKTTLLKADQRIYVTKISDFVAKVVLEIIQITILLLTRNYLLYLCIGVVVVLAKNFTMSRIVDKMYPYITNRKATVDASTQNSMLKKIKATFVYKLSNIIMNSTDNILISVMLGVTVVGRYSNYLQIVTIINSVLMILCESILASLGNFIAKESSEAKYKLFRTMLLLFYGFGTFCACCFVGMFNDFMEAWVGRIDPTYILSNMTVYVIALNFFYRCITSPLWLFRETAGIFEQVKYTMAISAGLNIILSIVLGKLFGLEGILIATTISSLATSFWYEPKLIYKLLFNRSVKSYWAFSAKLLIVSLMCIVLCALIGYIIPGSLLIAFLKIGVAGVITVLIYGLVFMKTDELKYILNKIKIKVLKCRGKE